MIITKTPLRIPLGGGGTDLPSYYSRHGGFLVSAAIDKYIHILVNRRFEDNTRVSYSKTEIAESVDQIEHPIVREALKFLGVGPGLEIISIADLPANTGLGSSSSFTVGLLHALHALKGESVSPQQLAEEAFHIEVERLGEPIGKQDQYLAAYGGITALEIDRDGSVCAGPLTVSEEVVERLENDLLLFYTGVKRKAGDILIGQSKAASEGKGEVTGALHEIKGIGRQVMQTLRDGDLLRFGELLHLHWEVKKQMSKKISSNHLDRWYDLARQNGAVGGKVMGAGGGGFFMFYCNGNDKDHLRRVLSAEGLRCLRFSLAPQGSKVMVNL